MEQRASVAAFTPQLQLPPILRTADIPLPVSNFEPSQENRLRRLGRRIGAAVAGGLVSLGFIAGPGAEPAQADAVRHIYRTDGDGLWLHSSPALRNNSLRVMPEGTAFNVKCWAIGDTVLGNPVWLYGDDGKGSGYATDYYIDTKWKKTSDLNAQGIPECGKETKKSDNSGQNNNKPGGGVVYFQPRLSDIKTDAGKKAPDGAYLMTQSKWTKGSCKNDNGDDYPSEVNGKRVTTLTGWSLGRLGITYALNTPQTLS